MKIFRRFLMVFAGALLSGSAFSGKIFIDSVNDLTPNSPLSTSPSSHRSRYVTSTGTASSFDLWYSDTAAGTPYVLYHVTGSYSSGGGVTLGTPSAVTLNLGSAAPWVSSNYAGYHAEILYDGGTYHMVNMYQEYLTGTSATEFTKQYQITYNPDPDGGAYPAYGMSALVNDGATYWTIQSTNYATQFVGSTVTPGSSTWTNHGYVRNLADSYAEGIHQPGIGVGQKLTASGDLVKEFDTWLFFAADDGDGGLGLADLGSSLSAGIANQN